MRKIEVVDYNPKWPELFALERDVLEKTLKDVASAVHHIGSTAVPGLDAKPIIDILIEVTSLDALDALNRELQDIGYEPKGEYGIAGRRYFQKGGDERTHQIHAFLAGVPDVARHIAFRDYLIKNQVVADDYGELKRRVAKDCDNDIRKYCDGKDNFVKKYETAALKQLPSPKKT